MADEIMIYLHHIKQESDNVIGTNKSKVVKKWSNVSLTTKRKRKTQEIERIKNEREKKEQRNRDIKGRVQRRRNKRYPTYGLSTAVFLDLLALNGYSTSIINKPINLIIIVSKKVS